MFKTDRRPESIFVMGEDFVSASIQSHNRVSGSIPHSDFAENWTRIKIYGLRFYIDFVSVVGSSDSDPGVLTGS